MFTKLGVILIAAIVLIGLTGSGLYGIFGSGGNGNSQPPPLNDEGSAEAGLEAAGNWILNNSPTYLFDGSNLEHLDTVTLNCLDCYGYIFTFDSAHAGYGERSGQVLAQVITPHTIGVATKEGTVIQAVTDKVYDEIRREFIPQIEYEDAAPQPE